MRTPRCAYANLKGSSGAGRGIGSLLVPALALCPCFAFSQSPPAGVSPPAAERIDLALPEALPRGAIWTADVPALLAGAARGLAPGVRETLAQKPSPYLVKAHDVGLPTDFNADIPWHALDKEKDSRFRLPHAGKLGLVNANSDVNFLIGLGVGDGPVDFNPPRRYVDHLINVIVQESALEGVVAHVVFMPSASDTVLAAVALRNAAAEARTVRVEAVCAKTPSTGPPFDRFGYGIQPTTGRLRWVGTNAANGAVVSSYEEWQARGREPAGALVCAMAGSEKPAGYGTDAGSRIHRPGDTGVSPLQGPGSPPASSAEAHAGGLVREAALQYRLDLAAGESQTLLLALCLHRYGPKRIESPRQVILYPEETDAQAIAGAVGAAVEALGADWPGLVRDSFRWYERLPAFRLPRASWAADLSCALELPRGNTWSAQGGLRQPWYTFCRAHGHDPYGWWSYGMHGHEHLSTFVVNVTEPALSQSFLRGHFQAQSPDGFIPYGVNHRGVNIHEGLATAPLLMEEAWTAYLWSGDRAFLDQAHACGARNLAWWRSPARTRERLALQHWRDFTETVRDDADLPTWAATEGAEHQEALDLNCYLLNEERALAAMARELGMASACARWEAEAGARTALMRERLWHAEDRVYYGKDIPGNRWARVMDISTFFPLWSGLATADQASRALELLRDPAAFGTDYPPATLAVRHMPARARGHWHWRGANWVEMSWLAIRGLKRYGFYEEAARLAEANCRMVFETLELSGHFREYFDSLTGAPADLTDYIWTSMPAIMAVDVFYGVRPIAEGLEVLPVLPEGWDAVEMRNLRVRGSRVSVAVRRDPEARETSVTVNGASRPARERRGVLVPWGELPPACAIAITQPRAIAE